ncbi:hypothetical protein [Kitasatospora terrestris]|uniref:hypothetical protein n=1 Tax=Kitasatospora terrestris TaxID=258051 RepID=UPI0031EDA51D
MDLVYASLQRRRPGPGSSGEKAELLAALWAHALPDDGLQHATARVVEPDRVDLLLYLLRPGPTADPAPPAAAAYALIARSHRASPLLRRRYLTPVPPPGR